MQLGTYLQYSCNDNRSRYQIVWSSGNVPHLYSAGTGLQSRLGHRPSWLIFFPVYLSPCRENSRILGWWPQIPFDFNGSKEQYLVNVCLIVFFFYKILDSPAVKTAANFPNTGPQFVSCYTSQIILYRYNFGARTAQSLSRQPDFDSRQNIYLYSTVSIPAPGPTQPLIKCVPVALSPGVRRPEHEAEYSHLSSAEAENGGAIPQLPLRLHYVEFN